MTVLPGGVVGENARGYRVDGVGQLGLALGAIDRGVSGAVQYGAPAPAVQVAVDRRRVGQVQRGA